MIDVVVEQRRRDLRLQSTVVTALRGRKTDVNGRTVIPRFKGIADVTTALSFEIVEGSIGGVLR
jgi:hypothetical protein